MHGISRILKCSGLVGFALLSLVACDKVEYLDGTPPPDAKLSVSELAIDTIGDSATGRTVRIRFSSEWKIDSSEFLLHRYVFGLEFLDGYGQWLPLPRTYPLPSATGTRSDTLSCTSSRCYWSTPIAHVLMQLTNGQYLSVAADTLTRSVVIGQ